MSVVIKSVYLSIVHLFNGLKGPRVCLVGIRATGLMETPPPWHATIYLTITKDYYITSIIIIVSTLMDTGIYK